MPDILTKYDKFIGCHKKENTYYTCRMFILKLKLLLRGTYYNNVLNFGDFVKNIIRYRLVRYIFGATFYITF